MDVCVYVCLYRNTYVCLFALVNICIGDMFVSILVFAYSAVMYVRMYVCMFIRVVTFVSIHIRM